MLESFKRISNPLTIIAIFAGITEIGGTVVLPLLSEQNQSVYLVFLIVFPCLLITLFFLTLNFNNRVLYAPSDFEDESNFVTLMNKQFKDLEFRLEKAVSTELTEKISNLENSFSSNENLKRAKTYFRNNQFDIALAEVDQGLELKKSGAAFNLKAMILARKLKYDKAIDVCTKGLDLNNTASMMASLFWNRACYRSLSKNDAKSAVDDLREAIIFNADLIDKLSTDKDLEYVRESPEFNEFTENYYAQLTEANKANSHGKIDAKKQK